MCPGKCYLYGSCSGFNSLLLAGYTYSRILSGTFGFDFVSARVAVVYSSLIAVGFFIYGPVALIGVQAVNLVPKNAAGTAAGFVGLFGYLIGDALLSKIVVGAVASNESLGWNATFWLMIAASIIAAVFSAATWKREKEACIVQGR